MTDEPAKKKKEELLRLLEDVESQAQRLERLGGDIVLSARLARDVAAPVRDLVSQVPPNDLLSNPWERQAESWRAWQVGAGELETYRTTVNSFSALSLAGTNTSSEALIHSHCLHRHGSRPTLNVPSCGFARPLSDFPSLRTP
jgi:hypothetical protein